jgi:hypothetical protein
MPVFKWVYFIFDLSGIGLLGLLFYPKDTGGDNMGKLYLKGFFHLLKFFSYIVFH